MSAPPPPLVIVGCTASGKSDLAEELARRLRSTIMAVDSMQVYRGMDIGTAKPDAATRAAIPHLMIDLVDPHETYSAARFADDARPHLHAPRRQDQGPLILVGGTILYLRALLEGLFEGPSANADIRARLATEADRIGVPALHARLKAVDALAAERIHPNDLRRITRALEVFEITGTPISTLQTQWAKDHPAINCTIIGIRRDKETLNRRINARVKAMLAAGLLDEVRTLKTRPEGLSKEAASAVGYAELLSYLDRRCSLEEAVERIKINTRHLAKMQRTWLKRFLNVRWLDAAEDQSGRELADQALTIAAGA